MLPSTMLRTSFVRTKSKRWTYNNHVLRLRRTKNKSVRLRSGRRRLTMMHGRAGGFLNQETIKPRNLSETLGRLGTYFGRFWYMIVLAVLFVVISTWTQVTSPELMGQATDCFLVPAGSSAFASLAPAPFDQTQGKPASDQKTVSSCWLGVTEGAVTV